MGRFIIEESPPLNGLVRIGGSKNAVLPIMAAALLCEDKCVIHDAPDLTDVFIMRKLLEDFGARIRWDFSSETIEITAAEINRFDAAYELVGKMRASFLVMGPLLARKGKVRVPLPGGCAIGARPVDLHLKGFAALGAKISQEHGYVEAEADKLTGANIYLDFPSVGATENIMMAAVLAHGTTVIQNCAVEPEIVDLANFLSTLGAEIRGTGTDTIRINGVKELRGAEYCIIPDRIEAGTFMAAAASTGGSVVIENVVADHLRPIIAKLREMGVNVTEKDNCVSVTAAHTGELLKPTDIKTLPYPGFPTDMQAQFMALLATAGGISVVTETVFENRFMHVGELKRMGADIKIEGRSAIIEGVPKLTGTQVKATDLRAGAALVVAALSASGVTEISDTSHIERGYCNLDRKLKALGARVIRVED